MPTKLTQEEFIARCIEINGEKFSYHDTKYSGIENKVIVHCNVHNIDFEIRPTSLLKGRGCHLCRTQNKVASAPRKTTAMFIEAATKLFGDLYDYSRVSYIDRHTKIEIGCQKHGMWQTLASKHLRGGGCPTCGWEAGAAKSKKLSVEEIISRASEVHKNKYTYHPETIGLVVDKMLITCPVHGDYWQNTANHLAGTNCPFCSNHGFDLNKTGSLYVVSVIGEQNFTGFGITNDPLTRVQAHIKNLGKKNLYIDDIRVFETSQGKDSLEVEQAIKDEYKDSMIRIDVDGFKTESTTTNYQTVVAFVEEHIKDYIAKNK